MIGTGPDGPVMAVSASVSQNTPVTAGTCVASHNSLAMETNYLPSLIYSKGTMFFSPFSVSHLAQIVLIEDAWSFGKSELMNSVSQNAFAYKA